jgi:branched-chain amino acid transport system permease protein
VTRNPVTTRLGRAWAGLTTGQRWLVVLGAIGLVGVVPLVTDSRFVLNLFILIFIFSATGHAWNIVGGYAGQVSLGHAIMWGIGAYVTMVCYLWYGITPYVGIFIGGVAGAIAGSFLGLVTFRLGGHYFAMATLAAALITQLGFMRIDAVGGAGGLEYPLGIWNEPMAFAFSSKLPYFYITGAFALAVTGFVYLLHRAKLGTYLKAISMDQTLAANAGIEVFRHKMYAMALSSFITGVAGGIYAQYLLFIDPGSMFSLLRNLDIMLIPVLGGLGTVGGGLLGAFIYLPVRSVTRTFLSGGTTGVGWVVFGIVLILISIYRPSGLLGGSQFGGEND